jgi:hypothetical protein
MNIQRTPAVDEMRQQYQQLQAEQQERVQQILQQRAQDPLPTPLAQVEQQILAEMPKIPRPQAYPLLFFVSPAEEKMVMEVVQAMGQELPACFIQLVKERLEAVNRG